MSQGGDAKEGAAITIINAAVVELVAISAHTNWFTEDSTRKRKAVGLART